MRCVMCHRPLNLATVTVPTKNGPLGYGPVCARKAGLTQKTGPRITSTRATPPRAGKRPAIVTAERDDLTIDMFEEIGA